MKKKAIAQIFETDEYDAFRKLEDNRGVLESRVDKLTASFSEKEILNPIVVNEKMEIIDGQGRFEACRRLGLSIKFIIVHGATVDDCRRMNQYNTKWNSNDFIQSYMKSSNPEIAKNYENLNTAMDLTGLGLMTVLRLANKSSHGHGASEIGIVYSGELVFTDKDLEEVCDEYEYGESITKALNDTGRTNEAFWKSINVLIHTEGFDRKRLIAKCSEKRHTYAQASRLEDQLKEFSRIYNSGLNPKNRIYFEDYMRNKGYNVRNYEIGTEREGKDISTLKKDDTAAN